MDEPFDPNDPLSVLEDEAFLTMRARFIAEAKEVNEAFARMAQDRSKRMKAAGVDVLAEADLAFDAAREIVDDLDMSLGL